MDMNRRNFLKGVALTAVGAVGATTLAACAPTASSDKQDEVLSATGGDQYNTAATAQRPWAFEIAPDPIPADQIAETIEADVVVVGCGTSGLMAANSAAEEGLDAIIVSASTKPTSRGGSNNAVYCKAFEAQGYPRVPIEQYQKEIFCQAHKVDQRKWYLHYNNSEEAMNWACDLMEKAGYGIDIEIGTPDKEDSLYLQRTAAVGWNLNGQTPPEDGLEVVTGKMQPLFVWELARHLTDDLGGRIFYRNIAEQLIREDDNTGRVTAVICKREDGSYAQYVGLGTAARLMRGSRDQNDVWARAAGAFRMKRLAQPCFLSRKGARRLAQTSFWSRASELSEGGDEGTDEGGGLAAMGGVGIHEEVEGEAVEQCVEVSSDGSGVACARRWGGFRGTAVAGRQIVGGHAADERLNAAPTESRQERIHLAGVGSQVGVCEGGSGEGGPYAGLGFPFFV